MFPYKESKERKYIQLTDHILLEYVYVNGVSNEYEELNYDYNARQFTGNCGTLSSATSDTTHTNYCVVKNGYLNERFLINASYDDWKTNNSFGTTVLPVNRQCTKWVGFKTVNNNFYSTRDAKWCNYVDGTPFASDTECTANYTGDDEVVYDVARVYFQSGYNPEYDGFVFNFFSKNKNGVYYNLLCKLFKNTDSYLIESEPIWYADKIYTNYIEFRIPSVECLYDLYDETPHTPSNLESEPLNNPMWYNLAGNPGISKNSTIGIGLYGVVGEETSYGYNVYKTNSVISTIFPSKNAEDGIVTVINQDLENYCIEFCSYFGEPSDDDYSLINYLETFGNTFTFVHQINVTETYQDENNQEVVYEHNPVTFIQTWDMLMQMKDESRTPFVTYRPILEHDGTASVTYILRITNNRDNTTIIKEISEDITNTGMYGKIRVSLPVNTSVLPIKVYNRIENTNSVVLTGTTNPIGPVINNNTSIRVNKYVVSSFIDRRNIKVCVSPVKIDNVE
ncbi:MAG: hypothetical protein IKO56_09620 [Alphaproteobacteria bacterium]|nr:hypothetical protein [Alphaproteobacteria bacterium]